MATARFVPVLSSDGSLSADFSDLEHLGKFRDARLFLLRGEVRALFERKRDVFLHSQRIKQRARLENHRDAAANLGQLFFSPIGDVLAGDQHAARVRAQEPKNMLQRHGFPHAAAPHDDARLSMVDKEAHVVQDEVIAKGFADVAEFDEVARSGRL